MPVWEEIVSCFGDKALMRNADKEFYDTVFEVLLKEIIACEVRDHLYLA